MKSVLGYHRLAQVQDWEKLARNARFQPAALARLNLVSLRHLERFFLARFRQTPGQWSRALKCRLACDLIAQGLPNKAVVEELGFANQSHLCHEFKRFLGVSPQSFSPLLRTAQPAPALMGRSPKPRHTSNCTPTLPVAFTQLNSLAPVLPRPDVMPRSQA